MTEDPRLWIALAGAASGVLLGFAVAELKAWWWRKHSRSAYWRALSAEAELCKEMAATLLRDNVAAPLYRLPTVAYTHSFPVLLADGAATEREVAAVTRFFNQVETLNRGLDQANDTMGDEERLKMEFARNRLKAEELVGSASYYNALRLVLDQHSK
jgi:hypothetical protein